VSRCKACDTIMTEHEMKKKDPETGEYLDLCSVCDDESLHAALELINGVLDSDSKEDVLNLEELGFDLSNN